MVLIVVSIWFEVARSCLLILLLDSWLVYASYNWLIIGGVMSRKLRIAPIGIAQHIIQRGNNRQVCFCNDKDMAAYVGWLKQYATKFNVDIHAWVLMTNHVHLLCTPQSANGVSLMMQSLGRMYVRYFNHRYKRTGTLWEGRFKSALIQSDTYLLQVYRYIELNPVRANMVNDPADYSWSSYQYNALGKISSLLTPHPVYLSLGLCKDQTLDAYQGLFQEVLPYVLITKLRDVTNAGLALGSERFIEQIEKLTGESYRPKVRGRPKLIK